MFKTINTKNMVFLFLTLVAIRYFSGIGSLPFHEDETAYLRKSVFFYLYTSRNFRNDLWQSKEAYDQPLLGGYFYGLLSFLNGKRKIEDIKKLFHDNKMDIDLGWNWNFWVKSSGKILGSSDFPLNKEAKELLMWGRIGSACFGFLTLLIVFLIGNRLVNWLVGILGVVILLLNDVYVWMSRLVRTDALLLFFLTATLYFLIIFIDKLFLQKGLTPKKILLSLILGAVSGGAMSVKLNGLMTLIICNVILVSLVPFRKKKVKRRLFKEIVFSLLLINLLFWLVFYILHPSIWQNFYKGVAKYFTYRVQMIDHQMSIFPSAALLSFRQKISAFTSHGLVISPYRYGNQPFIALMSLALLLVGIFSPGDKKRVLESGKVVSWWFILSLVIMMGYVSLDWSSYFLPIAIISAILQARGIFYIIQYFYQTAAMVKQNWRKQE